MGLESGIQFAFSTGLGYRQNKRALDLQQAQQDEMSAVRKAVMERQARAEAAGEGEKFMAAPGLFEQLFPGASPDEARIMRESFASDPAKALQDPNVLTARERYLENVRPLWEQRQEQQRQDAFTLSKTRHPMQATDREQLARTQATYKALGDALHQPYPQNPPIIKDEQTGTMRFMSPKEWYEAALDRAMSLGNTIGDTAPPGRPQPDVEGFGVAPPQPSPYRPPGGTGPARGAPPAVRRPPARPNPAADQTPEQTVNMRAPPPPKGDGKLYPVPLTQVPEALVNGYKRE